MGREEGIVTGEALKRVLRFTVFHLFIISSSFDESAILALSAAFLAC